MEESRPFLAQNDPNPFTSTTTIRMSLPTPGAYRLEIFDVAGRLVWWSGASSQNTDVWVLWDGTDQVGRPVTPGIYFYRASAVGMEVTKKMVVSR